MIINRVQLWKAGIGFDIGKYQLKLGDHENGENNSSQRS